MLRLLLLSFVLPFPSFLLKKICHVDLVKSTFDLKWNFVWWNLGGFSIKHCLVCFWCIISLILKRISRIRFNFLTSIFFLEHLIPKAVWVTEGRFMSWLRWNRSGEEQILATYVHVFSQHHQTLIPLWGPSSLLLSTQPVLPHSDLHQRMTGERKSEGGMEENTDKVFWEEQDVWSLMPFGNRHGNSEVFFIVFSCIYGLHVCRGALEWNETMQEIDCGWCPAT